MEEQQCKSQSQLEEVLHRLSSLQEENRVLAEHKNDASVHLRKVESELEVAQQVSRYFLKSFSIIRLYILSLNNVYLVKLT